jgi:hypothetical protein
MPRAAPKTPAFMSAFKLSRRLLSVAAVSHASPVLACIDHETLAIHTFLATLAVCAAVALAIWIALALVRRMRKSVPRVRMSILTCATLCIALGWMGSFLIPRWAARYASFTFLPASGLPPPTEALIAVSHGLWLPTLLFAARLYRHRFQPRDKNNVAGFMAAASSLLALVCTLLFLPFWTL